MKAITMIESVVTEDVTAGALSAGPRTTSWGWGS